MWPAWNCGPGGKSCRRAEKNWRAGCPRCELTEVGTRFKDETTAEQLEVFGAWPQGYDFPQMHALVATVSRAQSTSPDRLDPEMDLTFSHLVEILQQERNLAERVERANRPKSK